MNYLQTAILFIAAKKAFISIIYCMVLTLVSTISYISPKDN